uniref:Uncharacterized protein n=1 Tax=Anguilla anguilla TaxID=7936 RepID=A0A0E9X7H8_ANGAN
MMRVQVRTRCVGHVQTRNKFIPGFSTGAIIQLEAQCFRWTTTVLEHVPKKWKKTYQQLNLYKMYAQVSNIVNQNDLWI